MPLNGWKRGKDWGIYGGNIAEVGKDSFALIKAIPKIPP
jgi:hypothetical protein